MINTDIYVRPSHFQKIWDDDTWELTLRWRPKTMADELTEMLMTVYNEREEDGPSFKATFNKDFWDDTVAYEWEVVNNDEIKKTL